MFLPDVNILIYAHRRESAEHSAYAEWLTRIANGPEPFGLSELVCSSFVRIVTNASVFSPPTERDVAIEFIGRLLSRPGCRPLRPGVRNWSIFCDLIRSADARGKLVADAYHAALAIEHGCILITNDGDFVRFPGLRWAHPLRREVAH